MSVPAATAPAVAASAAETGLSADAEVAVRWIVDNADNRALPFAIVDKRQARLYLFAPDGALLAASPVLLGRALGDTPIADSASHPVQSLRPAERTTPAGRFETRPGHNQNGEDIVWFDYDAALALHRLRPSAPAEHRGQRLASARSDDKRISYGCVVVPVSFYDAHVQPSLGRRPGVVYVLPETRPVASMLGRSRRPADLR